MEGTAAGGLHPVENFLRHSKEGHCELFATAAALLLREMGVPARVVAGFRVSPTGDVLTARNTDAHAWVEVWVKDRGWQPVDPSPPAVRAAEWAILDLYDQLNAYWYQYIVGYEFDGRALVANLRGPGLVLAGSLFLLFVSIRLGRRLRPVKRHPRWAVSREWQRVERKFGDQMGRSELSELRRSYLKLRFGREEPRPEEIRAFGARAAELIRSVSAR
jgi:hypothetical protein